MKRPSSTAIIGILSAVLLLGGGGWFVAELVSGSDNGTQPRTSAKRETNEALENELNERIDPEDPGEDQDKDATKDTPGDTDEDPAADDSPDKPITKAASYDALDGVTIAIDPGHNGGNRKHRAKIARPVNAGGGLRKACDTVGAREGKMTESLFTIDVAIRMQELLEREGATVILTRKDDNGVGPCIDRRAAITNKADIAISVHADGREPTTEIPKPRGFHVIWTSPRRAVNKQAAAKSLSLAEEIVSVMKREGRGGGLPPSNYIGTGGLDKRDDLGGLNLSTVPKVFVEVGNMHDPDDLVIIGTEEGRHATAQALVDGLAMYLAKRKQAE